MVIKEHFRKCFPKIFFKAQASSITATGADFLCTLFFTEVISFWYLFSSFMGTAIGGYVNFLLGRHWVYDAKRHNKYIQAKRYVAVWTGSLTLNASGVFLFTDVLRMHYLVSKSLVTILVGVFFNFYLQKSFVFKS